MASICNGRVQWSVSIIEDRGRVSRGSVPYSLFMLVQSALLHPSKTNTHVYGYCCTYLYVCLRILPGGKIGGQQMIR